MIDNVLFFLKFKNSVHFIYDNITIHEALSMMKEHGYTAVPVIDNHGTYKGSVSEGDFLWYLLENAGGPDPQQAHVSDIIRPNYMPAVPVSISFRDLLEAALHQNYVPVVDDRSIFIGIVTRQTLLTYLMDQDQPMPKIFNGSRKAHIQDSLLPIH